MKGLHGLRRIYFLYLTTVNQYLTDEEAGYIIDDCDAQVVVASNYLREIAATLPRFAPKCHTWLMVDGTIDGYLSYEDSIASQSTENLADEPAGQFMRDVHRLGAELMVAVVTLTSDQALPLGPQQSPLVPA